MKQDKIISFVLMLVALSAISALALIAAFIFREGLPIILEMGLGNFIFSSKWDPNPEAGPPSYGIFPMIAGSLAVTGGALVVGVVFGLGCAIVLTQFCHPRAVSVLKPAIELLAGIPSVVYGFMGMIILLPVIRQYLGGPGPSVLAASVVLGIMMLPTVTSIAVDALQAVPRPYRDGSIALGATSWQTTRMVMVKAARSGLVAATILGMGRAIGETMAVIMVVGNTAVTPHSLLAPARTLTSHIALEMGYAHGDHRKALFATGVVLFVFIMVINSVALALSRRRAGKVGVR